MQNVQPHLYCVSEDIIMIDIQHMKIIIYFVLSFLNVKVNQIFDQLTSPQCSCPLEQPGYSEMQPPHK